MAIITNEDVLNAIRGRYQSNPNNVSDDAAQAELVQIKTLLSGIESKIHTIQNGTQPAAVELKGSYTTQSSIFTRALRISSQNTTIFRPAGAKGCIIYLTVYGVTGTFGAGQGVRLRAQLQGIKGYRFGDIYTDPQTTSNRSQIIMLYPGATDTNVPAADGGSRVIAPIYAPPRILLSLLVNGTFETGQGIDCEVDIEWLYG